MNSNKKEKKAIRIVEDSIESTGRLSAELTKNDKTPSWDGSIFVYSNSSNKVEEIVGCVPTQVKWRTITKLAETISIPVKIADLRNYYNNYGAIFFIIANERMADRWQIYYSEQLPFIIEKEIDVRNGKLKGTKSLKFIKFPHDNDEKEYIFYNFLKHSRKQALILAHKNITLDEIKAKGQLIGYSMGFTVPDGTVSDPYKFLFSHQNFLYARTPLVEIPVDVIPRIEKLTFHNREIPISINNRIYYNQCEVNRYEDREEICFGNGITFVFNGKGEFRSFKIIPSGTYQEITNCCDFIVALMKYKKIKFGDDILQGFDPLKLDHGTIEDIKKCRYFYYKLGKVIDDLRLRDKFDVQIDSLSSQDHSRLYYLVSGLLDKIPVPISFDKRPAVFVTFKIDKLNILTSFYTGNDGNFYIKNFYTDVVSMEQVGDNGIYSCSPFVFLNENQIFSCCNLDYNFIVKDIKKYDLNDDYANQICGLVLQMLLAYDKQQDKNMELLEAALSLEEYLYKNVQDNISLLNYCQVLKRKQELSETEKRKLSELMAYSSTLVMEKLAAAVLLEDFEQAEKYYQQLSGTERKDFDGLPINNLWKKEKND